MKKTLKLCSIVPTEQADGELVVDGFDPWRLEAILDACEAPKGAFISTAKLFLEHGVVGVPKEARAWWLSYMTQAKGLPLATREVVEVDPEHVKTVLKAAKAAKADMPAFEEAAEKTDQSLVFRTGFVGLFASKAPVRLPTLPDWCRGAIIVNTKNKTWEITAVGPPGKSGMPHLGLWIGGSDVEKNSGQVWTGNRFRMRGAGLPEIREAHYTMNALNVVLS